jgi:GT2 family glycosyltransferase
MTNPSAAVPLTAVLVTFNSASVIADALASLPREVPAIVVDNASTDASAPIAEAHGATVIRRGSNAGFGVANNDGWRAAATEWVLFLNPDARLRPGCMAALGHVIGTRPDAAVLVPTVLTKGGVSRKWTSPITAPVFRGGAILDGLTPIGFASGAAILVRRALLERIGGFDEEIFLYFEDDDLSRRLLEAGAAILHVPAAEVEHAGNVSSPPTMALHEMKMWHLGWSEHYVRLKHGLPLTTRWKRIEAAVKAPLAGLRRDPWDFAKQQAIAAGIRAAMRGVRAQDVRTAVRTLTGWA